MQVLFVDICFVEHSIELVNTLSKEHKVVWVTSSRVLDRVMGSRWHEYLDKCVDLVEFADQGFRSPTNFPSLGHVLNSIKKAWHAVRVSTALGTLTEPPKVSS